MNVYLRPSLFCVLEQLVDASYHNLVQNSYTRANWLIPTAQLVLRTLCYYIHVVIWKCRNVLRGATFEVCFRVLIVTSYLNDII